MNKIVHLLIACLTVLSVNAQYDPMALAKLESMSAKYRNLGAYSAAFSQQIVNEEAGIDESMKGTITIKGNKYLLEIADQKIYNNGETVFTYNDELKEVTINDYSPSDEEISLSNIYDLYKDGFKYVLMGETEDGETIIDLDPQDKDKSYYKIRMIISGKNELKKFTVFEKSGNKYVYTINSFKEDPKITDEDFTFDTSKKGIEVIDFR